MRSSFREYYRPTDADLADLWGRATFVFDTNVLLHLYRVPDSTRLQMLNAFNALGDRLWIPHQVGMEYQSRRLSTIHTQHQSALRIVKEMQSAFERYCDAVAKSQLAERGVTAAEDPLRQMTELARTVEDVVQRSLSGQLSPSDHDTVRDDIDRLFEGKIGLPPSGQSVIDGWNAEGLERFEQKRPPGYADAEKAKSESSRFYAQGLLFERQYGDLYLWLELLEHAKAKGITSLIFVTQDRKEDWWVKVPGGDEKEVLLPHPALAEEIRRTAGVERFWMYQLQGFLEAAKVHLHVSVSQETIQDVTRAADAQADFEQRPERGGDALGQSLWEARWGKQSSAMLDLETARLISLVSREKIVEREHVSDYMVAGVGQAGRDVCMVVVVATDLVLKAPGTFKNYVKRWVSFWPCAPFQVHIYAVQAQRSVKSDALVKELIREAFFQTIVGEAAFIHLTFVSGGFDEGPKFGLTEIIG